MTFERCEPPLVGTETQILLAWLDYHRATIVMKCEGLDAQQLTTTAAPSTLTLGGMLKHLAYVEDWWIGQTYTGEPPAPPWDRVDWNADNDWDWHSAAQDSPEHLRELYSSAVERSRALLGETPDLDSLSEQESRSRGRFSLRWILVHLLEEYARHAGHADLIRERVDGRTGT